MTCSCCVIDFARLYRLLFIWSFACSYLLLFIWSGLVVCPTLVVHLFLDSRRFETTTNQMVNINYENMPIGAVWKELGSYGVM